MKLCLVLICALVSLPAAAWGEAGTFARDFTLKDVNGSTRSLHDVRGKYVVLEWYNPACPFVAKQYDSGSMQRFQRKYTAEGVVWFTVVSSAKGKQGNLQPEAHKKRLEEWKGVQTALLIDEDGTVAKMYGARTTPHMFVIDKEGKIAYEGAVDNKPSTNIKDVETARNYVDEALQALLAGRPVAESETEPYGCSVKYE